MPHVIIKLWPGRNDKQKEELTMRIVEALEETINVPEKSISVAIEEIEPENWAKEVYKPDIIEKEHLLFKKPGYRPTKEELE